MIRSYIFNEFYNYDEAINFCNNFSISDKISKIEIWKINFDKNIIPFSYEVMHSKDITNDLNLIVYKQ